MYDLASQCVSIALDSKEKQTWNSLSSCPPDEQRSVAFQVPSRREASSSTLRSPSPAHRLRLAARAVREVRAERVARDARAGAFGARLEGEGGVESNAKRPLEPEDFCRHKKSSVNTASF